MDTIMGHKNTCVTILVQPQALFVNTKTLEAPIVGVTSTPKHSTLPVIRLGKWKGPAKIIVSCVTHTPPYRAHPFLLGSPNNCRFGVYTIYFPSGKNNKYAVLSNISIKILTEEYFTQSFEMRRSLKLLDLFETASSFHSLTLEDWSKLRLCFHAFVRTWRDLWIDSTPLPPVVSDPISLMAIENGQLKPVSSTLIGSLLSEIYSGSNPDVSSIPRPLCASAIHQQEQLAQQFSSLTVTDNTMSPLDSNPSTSQVFTERIPSSSSIRFRSNVRSRSSRKRGRGRGVFTEEIQSLPKIHSRRNMRSRGSNERDKFALGLETKTINFNIK